MVTADIYYKNQSTADEIIENSITTSYLVCVKTSKTG